MFRGLTTFVLVIIITPFSSIKVRDPWTNPRTPEVLRREVIDFRKTFDNEVGWSFGESCTADVNLEPYKSYVSLSNSLQEGRDEEVYAMFDSKTSEHYRAYNYLKTELRNFKQNQRKVVCPITKGMICGGGGKPTCVCKNDYMNVDPDDPANIKTEIPKNTIESTFWKDSKICVLKEGSACMITDAGWEASCQKPLKCYITQKIDFDPTGTGTRYSVPVKDDLCTRRNREKWDLPISWTCSCEYSAEEKIRQLKSTKGYWDQKTPLQYGDKCQTNIDAAILDLAVKLNHSSSAVLVEFYDDPQRGRMLRENENKPDKRICGSEQIPFKCIPSSQDATKYEGVCGCYGQADYNSARGECIFKSGTQCSENGKHPLHECPNDEECILDWPGKDMFSCKADRSGKVKLWEDVGMLEVVTWLIERTCSCKKRNGKNLKQRASKSLMKEMEEKNNNAISKIVDEWIDTSNKTKWKILSLNDSCHWNNDRAYFRVKDFSNAKLQHIAFKLNLVRTIEELMKTQMPLEVCDLTKSMRCHFKDNVCKCPIDGYFSEIIHSEYNAKEDKCFLKKNSLCHPTLTEWIKCPGGQKCLYNNSTKLPHIECNRDNRKSIIDAGIILKSARCTCTDEVPKSFETFKKVYEVEVKKSNPKKVDL